MGVINVEDVIDVEDTDEVVNDGGEDEGLVDGSEVEDAGVEQEDVEDINNDGGIHGNITDTCTPNWQPASGKKTGCKGIHWHDW